MSKSSGITSNLFKLSDTELADLSARVKLEIHRRTLAASAQSGSEIVGLEMAKRAITVAAAGNHSVVFVGREASGKTMLRALAARLGLTDTFEARPCPCGNHGDIQRRCRCTEHRLVTHQKKWPRADIFCEVVAPSEREFRANRPGTGVDDIQRVIEHKGEIPSAFDSPAENLFSNAIRELGLRPPAVITIRGVSKTIAALDCASVVTASHLSEAINYRMPD